MGAIMSTVGQTNTNKIIDNCSNTAVVLGVTGLFSLTFLTTILTILLDVKYILLRLYGKTALQKEYASYKIY